MKTITASLAAILLLCIISVDLTIASLDEYYNDDTGDAYPQNQPDYHDYDTNEDPALEEDEEPVGPPPVFSKESIDAKVTVGQSVEIPCTTRNPTTRILVINHKRNAASKKDKLLFVGELKLVDGDRHKLKNGIMTIENIKREDAGTYTCLYQNDPVSELSHKVDVLYRPKIIDQGQDQEVDKGDSVTLMCKATGNPTPTLTWSKVGGHIPFGEQSEEGLSEMTLEQVDRHVEGTYKCLASNNVGKPDSAEINVVVNYAPEIITEKAIIRTGEGDRVELVCMVHARPAATLTWSKDGSPIDLSSGIIHKHEGHRHILEITQVTSQNFGSYKCSATNALGVFDETISVTDEPKKPNFTSNPNSGEEDSYTLTWHTESYYPIQMYRIRFRKTKANDSTDMPGAWSEEVTVDVTEDNIVSNGIVHQMRHTFKDLHPATDYQTLVQVKNNVWGEEAMFTFTTKREVSSHHTTAGSQSVVASMLLLVMASLIVPYCS